MPPPTKEKNKTALIIVLFFVLGFVIYGNVMGGKFLLDDSVHVVANDYVKNFGHIKEIFSQDSLAGAGFRLGWYRPVLLLSYALDYSLWGLNSIGYHAVNIILHVISAVLLFFITLKLFKKIGIAFISGLIFLIHPVQTEAVSYISGRADLLLVLFLLISFFYFINLANSSGTKNKIEFLLLSVGGFILALLSKETAVVFPALLALYYFVLKDSGRRLSSGLFLLLPYIGVAAIYQVLRMTVLNFNNSYAAFGHDLFNRTVMFLKTLPIYWQKIIWPTNLRYHYETRLPIEQFDWQIIFSVLIIIGFLILLGFRGTHRKLILFGFGWFFIGMGPVSGILVPINFILGERWLYFSAIGFFVVAAILIHGLTNRCQHKGWRMTIITLFIAYGAFFAVIGIKRNAVWQDGFTFAKQVLVYTPQEPKLHGLLANEYVKRGQDKEALEEFKTAISLDPQEPTYVYNLGVLYASRDFDHKTMGEFNEIIKLSKIAPIAFSALADRYANRKDYLKAIKLLEKIVELYPESDIGNIESKLDIFKNQSQKRLR